MPLLGRFPAQCGVTPRLQALPEHNKLVPGEPTETTTGNNNNKILKKQKCWGKKILRKKIRTKHLVLNGCTDNM